MTEELARQIISHTEDEHTERKLGSNHFNREKLLQYTAALANEGGGSILLGVADDGTIRGKNPSYWELAEPYHSNR